MKLIKNIKKFSQLPLLEKTLATKIFFMAGIYRIIILTVPFKIITSKLSRRIKSSSHNFSTENLKTLGLIIDKVCRNTPWESKCLVQALICKKLCRKYGVLNILYIGVKKDHLGNLASHAWVSDSQNNIIVGSCGANEFKVITQYSDSIE